MAKGKFSKSRHNHDGLPHSGNSFPREEDTVAFTPPTEDSFSSERWESPQDRSMPGVDFHSFQDLDVDELTASFFDSPENPEQDGSLPEGFTTIPPRYIPSEEEEIEQSFQKALNRSTYAPSPALLSVKRFWKYHKTPVLIGLGCILLLAILISGGLSLYRYYSDPYDHRILSNVTVAGVNVGGMKRSQAEKAVSEGLKSTLYGQDMVISLPGQSISLSQKESGVRLDVGDAVKAAYRFGRTGSQAQMEEDYRYSLTQTHPVDLLPHISMEEDHIRNLLETYSLEHSSTFIQSSYALEGDRPPLDFDHFNPMNTTQTLLLIPGSPGFQMDQDLLIQELLTAYSRLDLSPKLTLPEGDQLPKPLDLDNIHQEYTVLPVDSSIDKDSQEVVSGSYGYTFDLEQARQALGKASYGDTVRIPMIYMEPETLDHEVFFQDVLSHAETPHGKNENRNENLRLACKAINGVVLQPGDEFSYNETLGQRTAEKGYKPAPAYSGEKLVNSLGGGICQVSSTLYWSCLLADLQITDRINHGFPPTYMSVGLDATVSWGGPDFKFRNNGEYPIQIRAEATDELVIVEILGTDDRDYYVKMDVEASYTDPNTVYQEFDAGSGYEDGEIIQNGVTKHYAKTYRCKYSKETDELLSRELEARSSYIGRDTIIAVVKEEKPTEPVPTEGPETPDTQPSTPPETQAPPPETQAPPETEAPPPETQAPPPETQAPPPPETQAPPPPPETNPPAPDENADTEAGTPDEAGE